MGSMFTTRCCALVIVVVSALIASSDQKVLSPCLKSDCLCGKSRDPLTGKMSPVTVKCERVFYSDIPNFENISTRTERILFAKNKITMIKNNSFKGLKTKEIDFTKNKISVIQRNAFNGSAGSLEKLVLKGNRLTKVPTKALTSLRKLEYLDLSSNGKLNITDRAFAGLKSLETLVLSDCNIKVIRYEMFKDLVNLKVLRLDNNAIKELGTVLRDLSKLEELDLEGNRLTRVTPSSIKRNKNIATLILKNNQLQSLPPVLFKGFKKLKTLNLDKNPIKKPFNLKSLAIISASLEELYLSRCQLTRWPLYPLGNLGQLKRLEIEQNDISKIPEDAMKNMTSLEILKLGNNPLQFTKGMFQGPAASLQELHLAKLQGDTPLTKLPLKQLKGMKQLILLDASHNAITEIDKDFFDGLSAIHYVFEENKIENISSDAFAQFTTPINLDLKSNLVSELSFVDDPSKFTMVNVSYNRISCDCHVYNLTQIDTLELVGDCDNHKMGDQSLVIGSDDYVKIFKSMCQSDIAETTMSYDVFTDVIATTDVSAVVDITDEVTNTSDVTDSDGMITTPMIQDDMYDNVTMDGSDGGKEAGVIASANDDPNNDSNSLVSKLHYYATFMFLLSYVTF